MNHFDSKYLNSVVPPPVSIDFEDNTAVESHCKERKNGFKYKDASEEDLEKILKQIQSKKVDKISKANENNEKKVTHCAVHGKRYVEPSQELQQQEQVDVIQGLPHSSRNKLLSVIPNDEIHHSEALETIEELQNEKSHYTPIIRHNSCRTGTGAPTLETIQEEATQSLSESDAQSDISEAKLANENCNQQTVPTNDSSTLIVPKLDLEGLDDSSRDELSPVALSKLTNDNKPKCSIQERKIIDLRKRIDAVLEKILKETIRIPEPDGVYDLLRRHKREAEFASRFSRNHLYQLQREVLELNKQMKDPNAHMHSHVKNIQRKIVATHQHSLQALEIYHNQMPMLALGGSVGKLAELVGYLADLTKLCSALNMKCVSFPGAPCFEEKAKQLQKLLSSFTTERTLGTQRESSKKVEHMTSVMTTTGKKSWENCLRSTNNLRVNKLAHSAYASSPHRQSKVNKHKERGKQIAGRKKIVSLTAKLAKLSLQRQLRNQAQKNMYSSPYAQSCGLSLLTSHPHRQTSKEHKLHTSEMNRHKHEPQPTEPSLDQHPASSSSLQPSKQKMRKMNTYVVVNKVDENIETMVSSIPCDAENQPTEPSLDQHPASSSSLQPSKQKMRKMNTYVVVNKVDENIETMVSSIPCDAENQEEATKTKPPKEDENLKMSSLVPEDAFLRNLSEKIIEMCEERVREKIDVLVNDLVAEKKAQIKDKEIAQTTPIQPKEAVSRTHEISSSDGDLRSALQTSQEISVKTLSGSKSERSLLASKCIRTGLKNAQLICLEHNDQIDTSPLARGDAVVQQQHQNHHHHCLHHSEGPKPDSLHRKLVPEVEEHGPTLNEASFGLGMSSYASKRSPQVSSSFVKLFLSKEEEAQVLKYRKKYHRYMKTNPMYHGSKQPWVMVEKLSDQLVTEIMQGMAEEVQMQFLADELYNLEFEKKKRSIHKS